MYIKIILFKLKSCVKFIITSKKNNLNIHYMCCVIYYIYLKYKAYKAERRKKEEEEAN